MLAAGSFAILLAGQAAAQSSEPCQRLFRIPSGSMLPTLQVGEQFLASMGGTGDLSRGDVILFNTRSGIYAMRVAALPGDRIAMRDGLVILNGEAVAQRYLRTDSVAETGVRPDPARRLVEQFPGEAAPHEIYDLWPGPGDDQPEQLVAPDHVFVLGDNRDNSNDSRFPRATYGVEQLSVRDIIGRLHMSSDAGDRPTCR